VRRHDAGALDDELTLRAERTASRTARHWVMRTVADAGVGGSVNQVVELLTAELVSNAVLHGPDGGAVRVGVRVSNGTVRVEVGDEGGGSPRVRHPEPTASSGRGLALVEALSDTWGTQPRGPRGEGKVVWFEVRVDE
jgi:anti-sigma regulatory factor (Ser/Thr protein kinase)